MKTYKLKNLNNVSVEILNIGAMISSFKIDDFDIVLSPKDPKVNPFYMGAIIGRCANRIKAGQFVLNDKKYTLCINNNGNHLHGGDNGFDKKIWESSINGNTVTLKYESKHMEEHYPGNLKVEIQYTLTDDNELIIDEFATCDMDTIVNLTNHTYFNLGEAIDETYFKFECDTYTPMIDNIPTGEIKNTVDFKEFEKLAKRKFDDNFIANDKSGNLSLIAQAKSKYIHLKAYTTKPAMQFYTADYITDATPGKNGEIYRARAGFCFECQFYPDSINNVGFPSVILKKGEEYKHKAVYKVDKI